MVQKEWSIKLLAPGQESEHRHQTLLITAPMCTCSLTKLPISLQNVLDWCSEYYQFHHIRIVEQASLLACLMKWGEDFKCSCKLGHGACRGRTRVVFVTVVSASQLLHEPFLLQGTTGRKNCSYSDEFLVVTFSWMKRVSYQGKQWTEFATNDKSGIFKQELENFEKTHPPALSLTSIFDEMGGNVSGFDLFFTVI